MQKAVIGGRTDGPQEYSNNDALCPSSAGAQARCRRAAGRIYFVKLASEPLTDAADHSVVATSGVGLHSKANRHRGDDPS